MVTALEKYQRLEAPGIWRADESAQRRDVIVSFGDATLTISSQQEVAVSHWSLAAVERLNKGQRPAIYAPGPDHSETLEIDDATMIEAISAIQRALARQGPHPRRLRTGLIATIAAVLLLLAVFWMPGAMKSYVARAVPPAKAQAIGNSVLGRMARLSGPPCNTIGGRRALQLLYQRLVPDGTGRIEVLPAGIAETAHLPGGIILLNRAIVEDYDSPDAPAGFILAEAERAGQENPLRQMLDRLPITASIQLLTQGDIGAGHLDRYAEWLATAAPARIRTAALLDRFDRAGISAAPYAFALDISGETTVDLIEGDPRRDQQGAPILGDNDWLNLQAICGG